MVPREGTPVDVLSTVVVVVVAPPPPDFGRYLIPLGGQLPGVIASVLTKEPSMIDPFTYRPSGTSTEWTKKIMYRIDTHVVVIIDLKELARVAIQANLEAICGPEHIDNSLTGVCICA